MKIRKLKLILEEYSMPSMPMYTGIPNSTGGVSSLPYDSWDNNIHGLKSPLQMLRQIMTSIMQEPDMMAFTSGFSDLKVIQTVKIKRVVRNEANNRIDVHFSIVIDSKEYWGCIEGYDTDNSVFKSELEKINFSKDFLIKVKGFMKKILEKWFSPKVGNYKVLKEVICRDWSGKKWTIHTNSIVTVLENIDWDLNKQFWIRCKGYDLILDGQSYYMFNYWFDKIK